MGQKVNPISMRLQVTKNWNSQWFVGKADFGSNLKKDLQARAYIHKKLGMRGAVNQVKIERHSMASLVYITIYTARVGVVVGKGGSNVAELTKDLREIYKIPIKVNIEEIKRSELCAKLVAENIAFKLSRRMATKRVVKTASAATMQAGAKGIKIEVSGRINGADKSGLEREVKGSVPLQTLKADIDYGFAVAQYPKKGILGVKVYIHKGELI